MIIFVGGLVGAGKSTIAKRLATEIGCRYYDADEIKKQVFSQESDYELNLRKGIPFSDEARVKVFDRVIEDLRDLRASHDHLVVDETLHRRELRHRLYRAAEDIYGDFLVIWVRADENVIVNRLEANKREGHFLDDPLAMFESFRRQFEDFNRSVIVCNNNGSPKEAVTSLKQLVACTSTLVKLFDQNHFNDQPEKA